MSIFSRFKPSPQAVQKFDPEKERKEAVERLRPLIGKRVLYRGWMDFKTTIRVSHIWELSPDERYVHLDNHDWNRVECIIILSVLT